MKANALFFDSGTAELMNPSLDIIEQANLLPYNQRFEFAKEKLQLKEVLGTGAFGVVTKAIAKGISAFEPETEVAVKTIHKNADSVMMKALISELKIMMYVGTHLNIVNLLGAVTKDLANREVMMICEYCCYGNLRDFLQDHRTSFDYSSPQNTADEVLDVASSDYIGMPIQEANHARPIHLRILYDGLNYTNLVSWSFQVTRGMDYLASLKIIHGDLAARNVLLAQDDVVKICDFGLAKSLYKNNKYTMKGEVPLPFKWLAPESMADGVFSIFSDVWAYGKKISLIRCNYRVHKAELH